MKRRDLLLIGACSIAIPVWACMLASSDTTTTDDWFGWAVGTVLLVMLIVEIKSPGQFGHSRKYEWLFSELPKLISREKKEEANNKVIERAKEEAANKLNNLDSEQIIKTATKAISAYNFGKKLSRSLKETSSK
ncbi:hypothetical protein [Vibrio cortegadensis]|uniref:Uncharacterized protein n=1 Tax=Vibrio cortegadensis TaxID=1328770 RepID=A0ABV4M9Q9_9VIBR